MSLKRCGVPLLVVLAIGAMTASSASAAPTTSAAVWRTGTSATNTTVLTGSQAVTASLPEATVLETEVGTTPLTLKATGLECAGCTIFNSGGGAKGEGKLKFTGVTVVTPSTCKVSGEAITTVAYGADWTYMIGEADYVQFLPSSGTTLATIKLEKGTGACAIAGSYPLAGRTALQTAYLTAVYAPNHTLKAGKLINETGGGELQFGTKPASITGAVEFQAGGKFFGTE